MLRQLGPALERSSLSPRSLALPARWLVLAVATLLLLTVTRAATDDGTVEVICPDDALGDDTETEYCNCNIKRVGSSRMLQVKCDFKDAKAALLTARFYPMGSALFSSAYVRISNAKGVRVTQDFMREWQKALSSALDIWHSGQVELSASPAIEKTASYKTFVGIGIIDCQVQGLPSMLIRDHHRGALRVKDSTVGVIEPGFIHNIDELRYLVLEDCTVSSIAGPITSQAALTLSHKELHTWNGLLMSNVTVDSIAPNAFNLTHRSDTEEVVMRGCHVGVLGTAGIKVTGDVALNITGNTFSSLQRYAIQVDSVKAVVFSGNTLLAWAEEALEGLQCPDRATLVDNSVVTSDDGTAPTLHFHPSCGVPKVRVVSVKAEMLSSTGSGSGGTTAVVVVVLLLLAAAGGGMVAGVWWWRSRKVWRAVRGDTPLCEDQDQPDMNNAVVNVCHMNKPEPVVMLTR